MEDFGNRDYDAHECFEAHTGTAAKLITRDNIEEYKTEMADYLD